MRHFLTQAELQEAIQYWLNEVKLQTPVTVSKVEPERDNSSMPHTTVLHVWVTEATAHEASED